MSPTSKDPAVTSYAQAPTRTVTTAGATYAYRELGPQGGIPVVFFVHLAATRDKPISITALRTQLKAIQEFGRSAPSDVSTFTQPTLIANGDNDRMVPSVLSEGLHHRIKGSELIIYPDAGHGEIFQFHADFAPTAAEFFAA